ncbi:MAG: tetratricopeptide repeat protein [Rhizobiales bacterium]|nr:tetratricopeptide repeat protein [Hyphomicrobiales bacterium]
MASIEAAEKWESGAVLAHVQRILATPEFTGSPQLAAFLNYIVKRKLAGDTEGIKAYSIATEALGRPPDFDPQNDPIVRVQAGRLRQALLIYYANPQADDSMRISLPVGSYIPDIVPGAVAPVIAQPAQPREPPKAWKRTPWPMAIAGLVFLTIAGLGTLFAFNQGWLGRQADPNPLGMPALSIYIASERQIPSWFSPQLFESSLAANLSRFDEFAIIQSSAEKQTDGSAFRLDLEFVGIPNAVIMTSRLVRQPSREIVWSNRSTIPEDAIGSYELLDANRKLASALGQPYGALYSELLRDPAKTPTQRCLLGGYEYFQDPRPDTAPGIAQCLERIVADQPGNYIAHILLGYMYAEQYRAGRGGAGLIGNVVKAAQRAVALKPDSAGSQQILMEANLLRGLYAEALQAGALAVQLNPNDSDVLADYGCALIYRGRYSEGETYAARAPSSTSCRRPGICSACSSPPTTAAAPKPPMPSPAA